MTFKWIHFLHVLATVIKMTLFKKTQSTLISNSLTDSYLTGRNGGRSGCPER